MGLFWLLVPPSGEAHVAVTPPAGLLVTGLTDGRTLSSSAGCGHSDPGAARLLALLPWSLGPEESLPGAPEISKSCIDGFWLGQQPQGVERKGEKWDGKWQQGF